MFYASNGPFVYRELGCIFNGRISVKKRNILIIVVFLLNHILICINWQNPLLYILMMWKNTRLYIGNLIPNFHINWMQKGKRVMSWSAKLMNMAAYVVETQKVFCTSGRYWCSKSYASIVDQGEVVWASSSELAISPM